jgi:tetratricopeptide (TPR) repeat protein
MIHLRKSLIIALLVVLGLGAVVFLLKDQLIQQINEARGDRLFEQAQEAFEEERWEAASRMGTAAHYLKPEDEAIQLLVARAFLKQRRGEAVHWWKQVLDSGDLPLDELQILTSALMNSNQLEEALPFLARLVELEPNDPETQRLWLRSLQLQRRLSKVMELSSGFVREGSEDWSIHRQYIRMQDSLAGSEGVERANAHLRELITLDNPLSLLAARELGVRDDISSEDRLLVAGYLERQGEDSLDGLLAKSLMVKEGMLDLEELTSPAMAALEGAEDPDLDQLMRWSLWMGVSKWLTEAIDWREYQQKGGDADLYFMALLRQGAYRSLIQLTESEISGEEEASALHLYYRARAWEELGNLEQALQTLNLAIDVVDPGSSMALERYLVRDNRWDLLVRLYAMLLEENPGNIVYRQKNLAALYYIGDQEGLQVALGNVEIEEFDEQPALQAFVIYLKMLVEGHSMDYHERLEDLMAEYPDIFDYRLVLGVSYRLLGEDDVGRSLIDGMPDLTLAAPRYIRVSSALLGQSAERVLEPGEWEYLLPKELYLLSQDR